MSPRDIYWLLAGAASGLTIGALGTYFAMSLPASSADSTDTNNPAVTNTPGLIMPGDRWPSLADVNSTVAAGPAGSAGQGGSANAGSLEHVTKQLAERLAANGGSDDEWRLLAQSYEYMGRTEEARAARMHVASGDAGARAQVNTNDGQSPVGATPISRISGTVQIATNLAGAAAPGTTLFVYATDPASPGPPLAVLRLRVDRWPVSFVLDDADAMIPGRNLSAARRIQVEARISPAGEALPRPGDLVGKLENVDPHTTQPLHILIDHKIG